MEYKEYKAVDSRYHFHLWEWNGHETWALTWAKARRNICFRVFGNCASFNLNRVDPNMIG